MDAPGLWPRCEHEYDRKGEGMRTRHRHRYLSSTVRRVHEGHRRTRTSADERVHELGVVDRVDFIGSRGGLDRGSNVLLHLRVRLRAHDGAERGECGSERGETRHGWERWARLPRIEGCSCTPTSGSPRLRRR
jgi:hypothetical protein